MLRRQKTLKRDSFKKIHLIIILVLLAFNCILRNEPVSLAFLKVGYVRDVSTLRKSFPLSAEVKYSIDFH